MLTTAAVVAALELDAPSETDYTLLDAVSQLLHVDLKSVGLHRKRLPPQFQKGTADLLFADRMPCWK